MSPIATFCFRITLFLSLLSTSSGFAQRLSLPFFDDFAVATNSSISPAKWINAGVSVYPSSTQAPSFYVATFDGRDAQGVPYVTGLSTSVGPTDSLTSRPIDLSRILPKDSLVLSFFYQAKGTGEAPDQEDSLILEVRTKQAEWKTIWRTPENKSLDFSLVLLPLVDDALFHADFQFRFRSFGRQTGPFDTWSVDYIYLDTQRNSQRKFFPDIAISSVQTSLLKGFQSMPFKTFKANPSRYLADSLSFSVRNLREFQSAFRYQFTVRDSTQSTVYKQIQVPTPVTIVGNGGSTFQLSLAGTQLPSSPQTIQYELELATPETFDTTSVASPLFRQNDRIVLQNDLTNYYAYDDGTAEGGADTDKQFGSVAVQFVGLPQDTLAAIQIAFSPTFTDLIGSTIVLQVHRGNKGVPGELLTAQAVRLSEPIQKNKFIEFDLTESVVVNDTFFVGWQRISPTAVPVGLDKNSKPFTSVIYQNTGSEWTKSDLDGFLLVRPVMGNKTLVNQPSDGLITGLEPSVQFNVFPNPTSDLLYFDLPQKELELVSLVDILGRLVFSTKDVHSPISLENVSNGTYFLKIKTQSNTFTKKIILSR
ncbi:MAG: T9SS type A sorting domain-containing protein [Spirosomataceae bacterium]